MDEKEIFTGAVWKEKDNYDTRDFNSEYVEGAVTDEQLENLPKVIDLISEMEESYKQGNVGACTATALCHTILVQNIFDHKTNKIFVDQKYQWTNNQWKERKPWTWGDELEHALKTARKNGIKWKLADWSDFVFRIDGYMFDPVEQNFERFLKIIAYNLHNKNPMYRSFRGNNNPIWLEILRWELKIVYGLGDCKRWHAIFLWKIDFNRRVVGIGNSRERNTKNKENELKISSFEISFDVFEQLVKNGVFNRRYRKVFDFKDIKVDGLFVDFNIKDENSEAYKAVKRAKEKWYIKGVPSAWWNRLYPERPITRLEMLLVLHRIFGWQ